jgi:hypothetical protein
MLITILPTRSELFLKKDLLAPFIGKIGQKDKKEQPM